MDAFNISCEFTMFEYIIYSNNQNILKFKRTNIKYRCSITYNLYCEIDVAGEGTIGRAAAPNYYHATSTERADDSYSAESEH